MQQAFHNRLPVKISAVKRLPKRRFSSNNEDQYKITKKSKVMPSTSTDYDYNDQISSTLLTVSEALQADLYKSIDVLACHDQR